MLEFSTNSPNPYIKNDITIELKIPKNPHINPSPIDSEKNMASPTYKENSMPTIAEIGANIFNFFAVFLYIISPNFFNDFY